MSTTTSAAFLTPAMHVSKLRVAGYTALWLATVIVLVIVLERFTNLPEAIRFGILMFWSLLAAYPIEKERQGEGRKLTFKRWALGMLVASAATSAISYVLDPWLK